jgi:aspartate ammonia-lyase
VYPTALQLAAYRSVLDAVSGLNEVGAALDGLAVTYPDAVRMGRTCLQDVLPVPSQRCLR